MHDDTKEFIQKRIAQCEQRAVDDAESAIEHRAEADTLEASAVRSRAVAEDLKALLEPGDTVTVTLKVDTTQAEKDIARTRIAVEQLASQFNSFSAGGNTLLTAAS